MGPGIPIISIVTLTAGAIIFCQILFMAFGRMGLRAPKLLRRLSFWGPLGIGFVGLSMIGWMYIGPSFQSAEDTYESIFGERPAEGVEVLEGLAEGGLDFGVAYVLLASERAEEIQSLALKVSAVEQAESEIPTYALDGPDWWNVSDCAARKIYLAESQRGWEKVFLMHCLSNEKSYAMASWID